MKSFSIGWNPDSIVIKLIGAFLLVMLPLCALSISITYYSSNQMQAEVERANESKVHFYYSHLEFELQRITGLVTEYSQDETLATFSTRIPIMSRYEVDSNLNNIYTKLKQIKETSPYISDVVYYVPEINKRVSAVVGLGMSPMRNGKVCWPLWAILRALYLNTKTSCIYCAVIPITWIAIFHLIFCWE